MLGIPRAELKLWITPLVLVFLVGANCLVWFSWWRAERGETRVVFLNVGQGDAILIEGARGRQLLVDGGPGPALLRELGELLPFYDRSLDVVLLTHPDADHLGGLPGLLDRYEVETVLQTDARAETAVARAWYEGVTGRGLQVLPARRGLVVWLEAGLALRLLFPDRLVAGMETNDGSVVAELWHWPSADAAPIKFILTGDAPVKVERYLLSTGGGGLAANVLKAGHHGSRTSTSPEFVNAVGPDYAVISAGAKNRYGHPHPEVLETLTAAGVKIVETKNGRVEFRLGPNGLRLVD